jgi:hypothetical protein
LIPALSTLGQSWEETGFCSIVKQILLEPWNAALSAIHLTLANGLERGADVLDFRRRSVVKPDDGHDVKSAALVQKPVLLEEMEGGEREPALFLGRDGFGGDAAAPGFDLHEDDHVSVEGDQVDLAMMGPVATMEDLESLAPEEACGLPLATITENEIPEGLDDGVTHWVASRVERRRRRGTPRDGGRRPNRESL